MIVAVYLIIAFIVGYLIGSVNFAKVFTKKIKNEDITEIGSKNPGTMNVLRTQGFGMAMLTLLFEAMKCGLPALASYFIFHVFVDGTSFGFGLLAYFIVAIAAIIGHCFPIYTKFKKGGHGLACMFGMFLFCPHFWWLSLIMFVVGLIMFCFIPYAFIMPMTFNFVLSVYSTVVFAVGRDFIFNQDLALSTGVMVALIVLVWLNFLFDVYNVRGNIYRLVHGTERKVDFKAKLGLKKKDESVDTVKETPKVEEKTNKKTEEEKKE